MGKDERRTREIEKNEREREIDREIRKDSFPLSVSIR
jgi:hypothetical protein